MNRYRLVKKWREYEWEDEGLKRKYRDMVVCIILTFKIPIEVIENILEHIPRGGFYDGTYVPIIFKKKKECAKRVRRGITIDLQGMDLRGRNLSGIHLPGIMIDHSRFKECIFNNAQFKGCTIKGCIFEKCTFKGTSLKNTIFVECTFQECTFQNRQGENDYKGIDFRKCILDGSTFQYIRFITSSFLLCSMKRVNFWRCNFIWAVIMGCVCTDNKMDFGNNRMYGPLQITQSNFTRSEISGDEIHNFIAGDCNFEETKLIGVSFFHTNFGGSNFKNADLSHSRFHHTWFKDTDVQNANFSFANVSRIEGVDPEVFKKMIYPSADDELPLWG